MKPAFVACQGDAKSPDRRIQHSKLLTEPTLGEGQGDLPANPSELTNAIETIADPQQEFATVDA